MPIFRGRGKKRWVKSLPIEFIFFDSQFAPSIAIEVLNVKVTVFVLLLFASLPDCGQNQTAVSDEQQSLSDF
jgi:hypothetical protein